MKQVNAVLVTLVLAEVSIQIGKSSDSMTTQGQVLKQNDAKQYDPLEALEFVY